MADPSVALQEALFARLAAEVSCPVYDGAPMDSPMPYVSIDREIYTNASPISGRKREQRLVLQLARGLAANHPNPGG